MSLQKSATNDSPADRGYLKSLIFAMNHVVKTCYSHILFSPLLKKHRPPTPQIPCSNSFHFIWTSEELFSCTTATVSINTFYPYLCPNSVFQKCVRNGDASITFPFLPSSSLCSFPGKEAAAVQPVYSKNKIHKITGLHLGVCLYIEKIMECEMEFKLANLALLFCL